jgi:hypothetical protein
VHRLGCSRNIWEGRGRGEELGDTAEHEPRGAMDLRRGAWRSKKLGNNQDLRNVQGCYRGEVRREKEVVQRDVLAVECSN